MLEILRLVKRQLRNAITALRSLRYVNAVRRIPGTSKHSHGYVHYLAVQVEKSKRYAHSTNARSDHLVGRVSRSLEAWPDDRRSAARVLCVGCRNGYELDLFQQSGFTQVTGVDLFQSDARITIMDMHALSLPTDHYDIVYSCHSLEHSFDPQQAISELLRVVKAGGVCVVEVPVAFRKSMTDLQDFGSAEGLKRAFGPAVGTILFCEDEQSPCGFRVARMAFYVSKHSGQQLQTITAGEAGFS